MISKPTATLNTTNTPIDTASALTNRLYARLSAAPGASMYAANGTVAARPSGVGPNCCACVAAVYRSNTGGASAARAWGRGWAEGAGASVCAPHRLEGALGLSEAYAGGGVRPCASACVCGGRRCDASRRAWSARCTGERVIVSEDDDEPGEWGDEPIDEGGVWDATDPGWATRRGVPSCGDEGIMLRNGRTVVIYTTRVVLDLFLLLYFRRKWLLRVQVRVRKKCS